MTKRRAENSNFNHSGLFPCVECGKRTRETGRGESKSHLCLQCMECIEWANGIIDGTFTLSDVPNYLQERVEEFL